MSLQLVIGNKNYSSWSMRSWVLMRQLGIPFAEVMLRFDADGRTGFHEAVSRVTPAGRVPVLVDDGFSVWDTLAIVEYLHERFPQHGVWPADPRARARARCLCAEMHAGFAALRTHCPVNIEASLPDVGKRVWAEQPEVRRDVARIDQLWCEQLAASGGPCLFGAFGAADAYFAPVCLRVTGFSLPVSGEARAYIDRILRLPAVAEWIDAALAEHDFIAADEPYRTAPGRP